MTNKLFADSALEDGMSLVKYTAEIVRSYVSKNRVSTQDVTDLIAAVHQSLVSISSGTHASPPPEGGRQGDRQERVLTENRPPAFVPIMPVDQAVTKDNIFCLICGKASKAIKGHLTKTHHIDIPTYRANYGLPKDFPMVAPSYSETRRQLAVAAGSGEKLQAGRERKKRL